MVYLGSLVIGTALGAFFLEEQVNVYQMAGLVLVGASIVLWLWEKLCVFWYTARMPGRTISQHSYED